MNPQSIHPLHGNVLVRLAAPERERNGIIIPENAQGNEEIVTGTVLAVGRGHITKSGKLVEPSSRKGDTVLFSRRHSLDIGIDNHVVVPDHMLLAVVD